MTCGVIVGRFQVAQLHHGHKTLFKLMSEMHDQVIVFIGISKTGPTNRNPLDFESRKDMILSIYPNFHVAAIVDHKSDYDWSRTLDQIIRAITPQADVTLYGGRDSFIPKYHGKFKTKQLIFENTESGTNQRKSIASTILLGSEQRHGAIHAIARQYPRALMTVDVVIVQSNGRGGHNVLLGKKPNEKQYRFVGGFVEPGETLEAAGRREVREEADVVLEQIDYIGSFPIDDWRYKKDLDAKITTALFIGWTVSLHAFAGDDLESVRWFDIDDLPGVEPEHQILKDTFVNYMRRQHAKTV